MAVKMYGEDCLDSLLRRLPISLLEKEFNGIGIHRKGHRIDVNKERSRARPADRQGRGNKRMRNGDKLIAFSDPCGLKSQVEAVCAAIDPHSIANPAIPGE